MRLLPLAVEAKPRTYELDVPKSSLAVLVHPTGKMARVAHEHRLEPTSWRGSFSFDRERPEATRGLIVVEASSLRERSQELNAADKKKIDAQVAGPEVLDAARHPNIRFSFDRLDVLSQKEGRVRGILVGTLFLHGVARPITVPISASVKGSSLHATGQLALEQSKFGIKPYATPLGTVGIQDRVDIQLDLRANAKD